VVAHVTFSDTHQLAQIEAVKAHLRYAQSQAMMTGGVCGIKFDTHRYWLFKNGLDDTPVLILGESAPAVSLHSGMSLTGLIAFNAKGEPFGDVALQVPYDGTPLAFASDYPTITVTPKTGFIP
jgi:hypothetical protein